MFHNWRPPSPGEKMGREEGCPLTSSKHQGLLSLSRISESLFFSDLVNILCVKTSCCTVQA